MYLKIFANFVIESNKPISGLKMEAETVFGHKKGQWFYFQLLTEIEVEPFKL